MGEFCTKYSRTLNPKPQTLNPKPSTLYPKPTLEALESIVGTIRWEPLEAELTSLQETFCISPSSTRAAGARRGSLKRLVSLGAGFRV